MRLPAVLSPTLSTASGTSLRTLKRSYPPLPRRALPTGFVSGRASLWIDISVDDGVPPRQANNLRRGSFLV